MKRLRDLSLIEAAWYLWGFKFTKAGKWLAIGLVVCGSIGSFSIQMPTFRVFCAVAALFGVAFVVGLLLRPRVTVSGRFPEKACAGHPIAGEFVLTNHGRRTLYDASLGFHGLPASLAAIDEPPVVAQLGPAEAITITHTLEPLKRGIYQLPPARPFSTFPFGLWRTAGRPESVGRLLVLPHFHPLDHVDIPVGARYQPGGIALTSNLGESPEYIGNRDYRPGDPWRKVDFRGWARLARPVVREYHEEYYHRIALVLDTFVPQAKRRRPARGFPQLEAAVSLSAAIADGLSRGEYILDLFAAGPELYVFRAGRNISHFDDVLEILACVDACPTNPFDTVTPVLADELSQISAVVCVFLDWDADRRELVRTALEMGCQVKVLLVCEGEPTEDPAGEEVDIAVYSPDVVGAGTVEAV